MIQSLKKDILIVGGGIAGLWSAAHLKALGYNVILIENEALGSGQSLASQGMIHGGQRYSLKGAWTSHADLSSQMPEKWEQFFHEACPFQLKKTKISSAHQILWSATSGLGSVISFFASKAMQTKTAKAEETELFKGKKGFIKYSGTLFKLPEKVIDTKSLLLELNEIIGTENCIKAKITQMKEMERSVRVDFQSHQKSFQLEAQTVIFTAGLGNEWAAKHIGENNLTQRRPLKQVLVGPVEESFYGHCITSDPRPRITITSHPIAENPSQYYWYLGGLVANYGTEHSDEEAIAYAHKELSELFPKINWSEKKWSLLKVDRAEPKHNGIFLPDGPELKTFNRIAISWPTKMTFAPLLAEKIVSYVKTLKIDVSQNPSESVASCGFEKVSVDEYPWDKKEREWFTSDGKKIKN